MRLLRTAACLAIAALASSAPAAASGPANGFSDVGPGHWAYAAVSEMGGAGVVAGYPDGSFKPSELVTHGEFIKMAFLAAGRPDPGNSAAGHWASSYYAGSVEAGYFTNLDIPEQSLGYAISRESMALIVSNILGEAEIPGYARIQRGIRDVGPGRAHEYEITKVYAAGIITGYPDKTFRPAGNLSRAEAATVIYRLENEGERVPPDLSEETSAGPTTLDRFYTSVEGNRTGFIGVIMTSTSTLPLTDIVDKITFENSLIAAEYTWETIPEYYKNLKYY
jgi:hypothetical protein